MLSHVTFLQQHSTASISKLHLSQNVPEISEGRSVLKCKYILCVPCQIGCCNFKTLLGVIILKGSILISAVEG